jgi:hypothetical protein
VLLFDSDRLCYVEINVRKSKGNKEMTIQRHWQHWTHRTQDENKQNKKHNTTQKIKKDEQHGHHQQPGMNPGASGRQTFSLLLIRYPPCWNIGKHASYIVSWIFVVNYILFLKDKNNIVYHVTILLLLPRSYRSGKHQILILLKTCFLYCR